MIGGEDNGRGDLWIDFSMSLERVVIVKGGDTTPGGVNGLVNGGNRKINTRKQAR